MHPQLLSSIFGTALRSLAYFGNIFSLSHSTINLSMSSLPHSQTPLQVPTCSAAREFSIHKFYNFIKSTGIKASKNTLYNFIDALTDVFFVLPLRKFSYSYKETEQSLPKIYLMDNGILTTNGVDDHGILMENLVLIELARRGKNICYYKSADGKEVDFVVVEKNKVKELIQVSFSLDSINTREREFKALLKASRELKCSNLLIITNSMEGSEKIKGKKIKFIPLWKWLLSIG